MFNCSPQNFTLVTAQQIKTTHATYVVFMCLAKNCFSSQSSFLVYERTGILFCSFVIVVLAVIVTVLSLLGKSAFWPNEMIVKPVARKVEEVVVSYKHRACESALKI